LVFPDDTPKGEWRTRWEWEEGGELIFPQAIRVTLKQPAKNSQKEPLVTAMTVPLITPSDKNIAQRGKIALLSPPGAGAQE
jgi:hypothetical protein